MSVLRHLCLVAILIGSTVTANEVEVIRVTNGAGSATQTNDLVLILQQLQAEVRSLRGQVELQQYELDKLKLQQAEMYADLDARLGGSSLSGSDVSVPLASVGLSGTEQEDYSTAFAFVKSQDLIKAESAFKEYLKRHPKAQRASNAVYWIGEVNLAQGKLSEAAASFDQLLQRYPKSAKIPDAMYKLGRVKQKMGQAKEAYSIWHKLVEKFPKASAAKLAKNALM